MKHSCCPLDLGLILRVCLRSTGCITQIHTPVISHRFVLFSRILLHQTDVGVGVGHCFSTREPSEANIRGQSEFSIFKTFQRKP
jgi:hypothetical protein